MSQNKSDFLANKDEPTADALQFVSAASSALTGQVRVPGDKSISHRAIMLGAIAEGITEVDGFLYGEDNLATMAAFHAMGVKIERPAVDRLIIHGVGKYGLKTPKHALDLGNSGTAMRLLIGLLAGQGFEVELTGDASLCKRPMARIADPLALMGAKINLTESGRPPVHIHSVAGLKGLTYTLPIASAQIKSALLLAGLYAQETTTVIEPAPSRDHTERMLQAMGYPIDWQAPQVSLSGKAKLKGTPIHVPGDLSSAAFFMVAACIVPGSDLTIEAVGINPSRTGIINILKEMGANIEVTNEYKMGYEPVADLRIRHSHLQGIKIPKAWVPLAIDEFPVILIAAACAQGETLLEGAAELRVKESDRIQAMVDGLTAVGISAQALPDGCRVQGGTIKGGQVNSLGDHRIAMAFAVAGLVASAPITIDDCANVATSFPTFIDLARQLDLNIKANY